MKENVTFLKLSHCITGKSDVTFIFTSDFGKKKIFKCSKRIRVSPLVSGLS